MEIKILYEDSFIIVCVKPAGIVSESGGMPEILSKQLGTDRIYCVHRLDRGTSGIMLYAKDEKPAGACSRLFAEGLFAKHYCAVVCGYPESSSGTLEDFLYHDRIKNKTYVVNRIRKGVKPAKLSFRIIGTAVEPKISLLDISLETGRSHQIRAQFSSRGLPLFGDRKYGGATSQGGIALISRSAEFPHPITGEPLRFSIPLPDTEPWSLINYITEDTIWP